MISVSVVRNESGMDLYGDWSGQDDRFTFVLISYGSCVFWIEGEKRMLNKGDALLIPMGISYYYKSIPTVFLDKFAVHFSVNQDHKNILPILTDGEYKCGKIGKYDLILDRIKSMHIQWEEQRPYYKIMSQALLLQVLTLWNIELDRGQIPDESHKQAELMKAYIQKHYRQKMTKEKLASAINKSPNYAASLFSKVTGQTISEYVHAVRIKNAIYYLEHSQLTIAEISEVLGYRDLSYFYRVFKRLTGKTPSELLQNRPRMI